METINTRDYGALQQRVSGIESGIGELRSAFASLAGKIDERGRTQWSTLISLASVLIVVATVLGRLAISPIADRQAEMWQEFRTSIVPRSEHVEKWLANTRDLANLQRQLDDIRNQFVGLYSARDVLKDMSDRLSRLETESSKKM